MKLILIVVLSLLMYYLGLTIVTRNAFKKRKIKIGLIISLFFPLLIMKTYINVIFKKNQDSYIRKKATVALFLNYNIALLILVEVVVFGFEKDYIKSSKKKQKTSVLRKIGMVWEKGNLKSKFSDSVNDYMFA